MAIHIRLSRGGSKKRPYYRIVVADARSPRDGKFIEKIGNYDPRLAKDDEKRVVIDADRAKHWLGVGAQPTDRVARFLDAAGVLERTARNNPNKGKPGEKATERADERAEKVKAAEEAAAEAAAAPAPEPTPEPEVTAEAPVEAEAPAVEEAPAAEEEAPTAGEAPAAGSNEEAEAVVAAEVEAATEAPSDDAEKVADATAEQ